MTRDGYGALAVVLVLVLVLVACGGGGGGGAYSAPAAPSAPGQAAGGAGTPTVRITATGVSPRDIRIEVGGQVMFVNEDTRTHEMLSDPHPVHTGCPEINQVGDLSPGQSRMTAPFRVARSCGFHDNLQDSVAALRGNILVGQGTEPGPGY